MSSNYWIRKDGWERSLLVVANNSAPGHIASMMQTEQAESLQHAVSKLFLHSNPWDHSTAVLAVHLQTPKIVIEEFVYLQGKKVCWFFPFFLIWTNCSLKDHIHFHRIANILLKASSVYASIVHLKTHFNTEIHYSMAAYSIVATFKERI